MMKKAQEESYPEQPLEKKLGFGLLGLAVK